MDYINLISPYHHQKPRFMALVQAVLSQAEELMNLITAMPSELSTDRAAGVCLDLLGALVGVSRPAGNMADSSFRLLVRAGALLNHWPGSNETVPDILSALFPGRGAKLTDNQDGTVTFMMTGALPPVPLEEILPVPAGVKILYGGHT